MRVFGGRLIQRAFSNVCQSPKPNDNIIVAMSGGVDSSVTAALLKCQGFNVKGVYMRNWDTRDENGSCPSDEEWVDVQKLCKHIKIPCDLIDLSREYWLKVWETSMHEYAEGSTPNPDVMCNRYIKFGALVDRLNLASNEWIATGHYARLERRDGNTVQLLKALDSTKDQSYFLSTVKGNILNHTLFPLGNYTKAQVRKLARKWQLPTAERPESMGICFIGERGRFSDFLSSYIPSSTGPIKIHGTCRIVGEHGGLYTYTIGQRVRIVLEGQKWFVAEKSVTDNTIFIVPGRDHPLLYSTEISLKDWHSITKEADELLNDSTDLMSLSAVLRHGQPEVTCKVIDRQINTLTIRCEKAQRAATPGQNIVLYDGEWCLGGGVIYAAR